MNGSFNLFQQTEQKRTDTETLSKLRHITAEEAYNAVAQDT
jgi:hypothetical protein